MHPLIRVLVLLALATALPMLALRDLLGIALLLLLVLTWNAAGRALAVRLALRLRWLLLALWVMYAAFTAGEPVSDLVSGLSREGVLEGSRRVLALLNLVGAVALLLAFTPAPALAATVAMLLRPTRVLGWNPDRFATRLSLTLEEARIGPWRPPASASRSALLDALAGAVRQVEQQAEQTLPAVALPALGRPPWWQWLLLAGWILGLHMIPA